MKTLQSIFRSAAGLAALAGSTAAMAHPGHGLSAPDSLLHALEAEHVVGLLAVLAVGYGVVQVRAIRRRRADRTDHGDRSSNRNDD